MKIFLKEFTMAPRTGFEPVTYRLTAGCSTAELSRNKWYGISCRRRRHIMKKFWKVKFFFENLLIFLNSKNSFSRIFIVRNENFFRWLDAFTKDFWPFNKRNTLLVLHDFIATNQIKIFQIIESI